MKVSTSILSIHDNFEDNLKSLCNTSTDYIHLDIMDGIFVQNKTWECDELSKFSDITKPLDIHLMVTDIKKYVDASLSLHPLFITFHYEACDNIDEMIEYIKSKGIKVGMAIKPNTDVEAIMNYLNKIDLVLVMSVNPGFGGQEFMLPSINKINALKEYRDENNLNYVISVDGGINDNTAKLVFNTDILVAGSYITSGNYDERIDSLKNI